MLTATLVVAASLVVGQDAESPAYEHLKDLECFIGTWQGQSVIPESNVDSKHLTDWAGKTVYYRMTVRWAPGKSAQISDWVHDIPGEMKITATRITGWDSNTKKLTSQTFTTQKGVWEGTSEMRGDTLVATYVGFNLDGRKCTGVAEMRAVDKNTIECKDLKQTVEGKAFPDATYTLTRVVKTPPPSNYQRLKALEFLIGEWEEHGEKGGRTTWSFRWTEGKNGIQNVITGYGADGQFNFSNMGVLAWNPESRRITNWCVTQKGKAIQFHWAPRNDGTWENWAPGSSNSWVLTPIDKDSWKIGNSGGMQHYKRIPKSAE
jgi:hypothetical protein